MIEVHHGREERPLLVNADLIETVEATPDTVLTLTTGKKLIVRETPAEIVALDRGVPAAACNLALTSSNATDDRYAVAPLDAGCRRQRRSWIQLPSSASASPAQRLLVGVILEGGNPARLHRAERRS